MGAEVVFDPADFRVQYPEFAGLSDATLQRFFDWATLYLCNHANSPVPDLTRRRVLLYLLTAHCAALWYQAQSQAPGGGSSSPAGAGGIVAVPMGQVGRVNSASEGSVSIGLDYTVTPGGEWFTQTQYGAAFWQAVRSLIGFRYIPMRIPG